MKKYVLISALFSLFFLASCDQVNEAKLVVEDFYKYRQEQNYEKVLTTLSDEIFKLASEEQIKSDLEMLDTEMGKLNSYKSTGFNISTNNGITTASFTYKVVYENGVMIDSIALQKQNEEYKIYYYYWQKK